MLIRNIIATCTFAAVAAGAQAHAKITASEPAAQSELHGAPKHIRLTFNEALEPAFSKIALFEDNGAQVPLPKMARDPNAPKVLLSAVPALPPGQYRVRWSAMGHDGHKTRGEFAFRIR